MKSRDCTKQLICLVLSLFCLKILGLIRDRLLAHSFGASSALDIYYAAFRIPDFIFVAIASVVSVFVLVPFLIDKLDRSFEEGKNFIDNIFSSFFSIIIAVSLLAFFFSSLCVRSNFPWI